MKTENIGYYYIAQRLSSRFNDILKSHAIKDLRKKWVESKKESRVVM